MKKMKSRRNKERHDHEEGQRAKAEPKPKYRKPPHNREHGTKPDYTRNGTAAVKNLTPEYVTDVGRLLNGAMDKERYRIDGAEFEKEMIPLFKGAQESDFRCAVRFIGATEGHRLILSGVQPGTNILSSTLAKEVFFSRVRSVEFHRALGALHKYLRGHLVVTSNGKAAVANFKPATKPVDEPLPTDPKLIWDGKEGFVEIAGMQFRVSAEKEREHQFLVVRVHSAPQGTELADLGGKNTYVTVVKLHNPEFLSPFPEGSDWWKTQKRIWDFLRGEFVKAGITGRYTRVKTKPVSVPALPPKPKVRESQDPYRGSSDLGQLASWVYGDYVLGGLGARALVRLRRHRSKTSGKVRLVVELIRCEEGNFLYGKCGLYTHIPHLWLKKELEQIEILGYHAPDMAMLHIYLTGVIDANRKEMYAGTDVKVASFVKGGHVVNPPQVRPLSAEPPKEGEHLH